MTERIAQPAVYNKEVLNVDKAPLPWVAVGGPAVAAGGPATNSGSR